MLTLVGVVIGYAIIDWRWPGAVNRFEEGMMAILLVLTTFVTFSQVVARYGFSSGWTGALELTRLLFAWLILFGMSYALKINSHLGVDAFIRLFPRPLFRAAAIFGAARHPKSFIALDGEAACPGHDCSERLSAAHATQASGDDQPAIERAAEVLLGRSGDDLGSETDIVSGLHQSLIAADIP